MAAQTVMSEKIRLDWLGVVCSVGCAVHCAAMPIVVATLPSLTSIQWLADPLFHQLMAVICGLLVIRAILPGYQQHRDNRVVLCSGFGMLLLFVAAFILPDSCCSQPRNDGPVQVAQAPTFLDAPQIKLISTSRSLVSKVSHQTARTSVELVNEGSSTAIEKSDADASRCGHYSAFSRPMLSAIELEGHLGASTAEKLIRAQPFLSPIGGLFLIVAHILNLRLQGRRRVACCKTHD